MKLKSQVPYCYGTCWSIVFTLSTLQTVVRIISYTIITVLAEREVLRPCECVIQCGQFRWFYRRAENLVLRIRGFDRRQKRSLEL